MRKTLSILNKIFLAKRYPKTAGRLFLDGLKDKLNLRTSIASPPQAIVLYVTEACNLRCPMCAVWQSRDTFGKQSAQKRFYSLKEVKHIVSQVESFHPMFYFIGGEPTLNQDLMKMISYVHKKGMITQITTNGWFLSTLAQPLFESGIDLISVSLDDANATMHDKERGVSGVFDRATQGIRKMIEIKRKNHARFPSISINTVIAPWNVDRLEDIVRLGKDLGVEEISFQNFSFFGKDVKKINDAYVATHKTGEIIMGMPITGNTPFTKLQIKTILAFLRRLPELSKQYNIHLYNNHYLSDYEPYYQGRFPSRSSYCYRPWHILTIRGSGDVEICQGLVAGNIRKDAILAIWNNKKYQAFRKVIQQEHITPACYRCCFLHYCFD